MRQFEFETTVEIEGVEIDVVVDAEVEDYIPATYEAPADDGGCYIIKVVHAETGADITERVDEEDLLPAAEDHAPTKEDEEWANVDFLIDAKRDER